MKPIALHPGRPRCADPRARPPRRRAAPPGARCSSPRPSSRSLAVLLDRPHDIGPRLVAELIDCGRHLGAARPAGHLLLAWRLIAVGSSLYDPALPRPGRRDMLPIALILLIVIAPQAYAGYATETIRETADEVFVEPAPAAVVPSFSPEPDPENLDTRRRCRAGRRSPRRPVGQPDRAPGDRPDRRRRLGCRPEHVPDRHDDRGLARSGVARPSR